MDIPPQHPEYLPTLTVTSHWQPFIEIVTATQNMSSRLKNFPRAWPNCVTWGSYSITLTDAQGRRRRSWCDCLTNGALHQTRWSGSYGYCCQQDHPRLKPPRQWRFATTWHPTILTALTPDRCLSRFGRAYATPLRWGQKRRPPSECAIPPRSPPQGSQQHALWSLSILGASKSWKPPGWRNQRGT